MAQGPGQDGRARHAALKAGFDGVLARLAQQRLQPVAPASWFLGPNGENRDTLMALLTSALDQHVAARRDYAPDDPDFVTEQEQQTKVYKDCGAELVTRLDHLMQELRGSIPLSSYRNQSHMYWDLTLPGIAGYVAGMLFNQNNVAAEASPVTTAIEFHVAADLCRMLGYRTRSGQPRPWGHITCDGSVANAEAMWAARNLRFQSLALARAIAAMPELAAARNVTVLMGDGQRRRLLELSDWDLLNLPTPAGLGLPDRLRTTCGVAEAAIVAALERFSVQSLGMAGFHRANLGASGIGDAVVLVPATAHYSWPKAGAILGLGTANIRSVPTDLDGRMDLVELRRAIDRCQAQREPVALVVAVMGSTGESAVDPLSEIAALREEYRQTGLDFAIHADAAWGGYFASLLRAGRGDDATAPPGDGLGMTPEWPLSDHVRCEMGALELADSITVDPHKAGFIPYPAGALCYRDEAMPGLIRHTSPVVFHDGAAPTVGVYGIEGSKPGAAATAVYLSHHAIPPDRTGYGQLLSRCIFNSKRFYAALVTLAGPADPFIIVPFNRLPAERAGLPPTLIEAERGRIRDEIVGFENDQLMERLRGDSNLLHLFQALGPDLTVCAYALNLRTATGINRDPHVMNALNDRMFRKCSVEVPPEGGLPEARLFLTDAAFDPNVHGESFVAEFARRAGVCHVPDLPLTHLISTAQNPWLTDTAKGNFIPHLMGIFRDVASEAVSEVITEHGLTPMGA